MTTGSARNASMIAREDVVDRAAEVAGDQAERGAEHGGQQRRQRRRDQDPLRAHDDAREHVAAEPVRAEPVVGRRRREVADRVGGQRVLHDQRSPNIAQRIQKPTRIAPMMKLFERTSSRNCSLRAVRPSSAGTVVAVVPASASSNRRGERLFAREAHSGAPSRTRGLSTEYRMSAISVAIR